MRHPVHEFCVIWQENVWTLLNHALYLIYYPAFCYIFYRKAQKVRFDTADVFGGIDDGDKYLEMVSINRNSSLWLIEKDFALSAKTTQNIFIRNGTSGVTLVLKLKVNHTLCLKITCWAGRICHVLVYLLFRDFPGNSNCSVLSSLQPFVGSR